MMRSEVASALVALATLAWTDVCGAELFTSPALDRLLCAERHALFHRCALPELGDGLWALCRLGWGGHGPMKAEILSACEADVDLWIADTLQGHSFFGRLLWAVSVLCDDETSTVALHAARRATMRLPELVESQLNPSVFVPLFWALVAMNALDGVVLGKMLAVCFGFRSAARTDSVTATLSPRGSWEWSLLYELMLFATPRVWPCGWLGQARCCWDHERVVACGMLPHGSLARLGNTLSTLGLFTDQNCEARLQHCGCGLVVDAAVAELRLCFDVVAAEPEGCIQSGTRVLKWRLLRAAGWTVVPIPAAGVLEGGLEHVRRAIECSKAGASPVAIMAPKSVPDAGIGDERAQLEEEVLSKLRRLIGEEARRQAAGDSSAVPALSWGGATLAAPCNATSALALTAASSTTAEASTRSLVLLELRHGEKRKRLQLHGSVSVGQLVARYGKVVKDSGEIVVVDQHGIEHSPDITLDMLAEEESLLLGAPIRLEFRVDDW